MVVTTIIALLISMIVVPASLTLIIKLNKEHSEVNYLIVDKVET